MSKGKTDAKIAEPTYGSKELARSMGIHEDRLLGIRLTENLEDDFKITQSDLLKLYRKYYPEEGEGG